MKTLIAALTLPLALSGCSGTISSVSIPTNAPWQNFETSIASPYNDLTATAVGSNINVTISPNAIIPNASVIGCKSTEGTFLAIPPTDCATRATELGYSTPTVLGTYYLWSIVVNTETGFTNGGVEIISDSVGTVFSIALNKNSTSLNIGAGVSQGILPGSSDFSNNETALVEEWGHLLMAPAWPEYGAGNLCADGSQTLGCPGSVPTAICLPGTGTGFDGFAFNTNVSASNYSVNCGNVPVNLTLVSGHKSLGACIDASVKSTCTGLKGQARAACVTSQIGVCHASFNVPSALNPQ